MLTRFCASDTPQKTAATGRICVVECVFFFAFNSSLITAVAPLTGRMKRPEEKRRHSPAAGSCCESLLLLVSFRPVVARVLIVVARSKLFDRRSQCIRRLRLKKSRRIGGFVALRHFL